MLLKVEVGHLDCCSGRQISRLPSISRSTVEPAHGVTLAIVKTAMNEDASVFHTGCSTYVDRFLGGDI